MSYADFTLFVILGGFVLFGLWFGFIHTLGSLVGSVIGAFVASHFYGPIAQWVALLAGGHENLVKVIVFILLFLLVNRLVGFAFWIAEKIFHILTIIPFLSSINRLLGGILGLIEGVLMVGITLFFISKFPIYELVTNALANSKVAAYLIKLSSILWPLLPIALKQLQSYF